jgi:hypothetical protein
MKHRLNNASPEAPINSTKSDLKFFSRIYQTPDQFDTINWKKISPKEMAIIKAALSQADKLRSAAWDPGAAYLSGVADVLSTLHKSPRGRVFRKK